MMNKCDGNPLNLKCLNHISLVCRSVEETVNFYQNVLGFLPIKRPTSFNFEGAWLSGHGVGIHLIKSEESNLVHKVGNINPKDRHISFQCESMTMVENKLKEMKVEFVKRGIEENGILVDQFFFHDPDGYTIEICSCENFPIIALEQYHIR